jgi:hypothetical protein
VHKHQETRDSNKDNRYHNNLNSHHFRTAATPGSNREGVRYQPNEELPLTPATQSRDRRNGTGNNSNPPAPHQQG